MKLRKILLAIIIIFLLQMMPIRAADLKLSFDHYYDEAEVNSAIRLLEKYYPELIKVSSIGKSEEGRDLWLITINNPKTGKDIDKPGIYVDGTIHGNEIQATEVCLYIAYYIMDKYDELPIIRELVDTRAFYIIPTVNVDSRSRFFAKAANPNIGRSPVVPVDDDNDGLVDEDDYDDLDSDGEILQMRIKDPYGRWKEHPDDPRVLIEAEPGEWGEYTILGYEGIDNDGDGRLNEDTPGYLDMNRNYGFKWQPPYVQSGAGEYPMSGKITKAISDFVMTKPNICFNLALHNTGALIVRGPGSKLAGLYPPSDIRVYDFLGKEGEKIIPGYKYIIGGTDMYTTHGDFDEWMFSCLGIYGFVGELSTFKMVQYRKEAEKVEEEQGPMWFSGSSQLERQKFNDNLTQGSMFVNWKKFKHPQFGEVELGGWRKLTTRVAPPFMLPEEVHRMASLLIFVARHTPEIKLELIEVKKMENGLKRVRMRAVNSHALPTLSGNALRRNVYRKDIFAIEGKGLEVLSGAVIDDLHWNKITPVEYRPEKIFTYVPGFGTREVQWIVRGSGKATVSYDAIKTGNRKITIDL